MKTLISVEKAQAVVHSHTLSAAVECIPFSDSFGRVLAEDVVADRHIPPYHRVCMDGFAVASEDIEAGITVFPIEAIQETGKPPVHRKQAASCIEVMTGCVLPLNTDTIIPYEACEEKDRTMHLRTVKPRAGQHVHTQGSDYRQGERLLTAGRLIDSPDIAVLASVGKTDVQVRQRPTIACFSTGDEVVSPEDPVSAYQIRRSNLDMLRAALAGDDLFCSSQHVPDNIDILKATLGEAIASCDAVLITGAVSKGAKDFVPNVLTDLGADILIHGVRQRPGKPFLLAKTAKCMIFTFPGNPVSAFVCYQVYFRPWLRFFWGLAARQDIYARLAKDVVFKPALTYFLPVHLYTDATGIRIATPHRGNGSGDYVNLTRTNAIMILPEAKDRFEAGSAYPIIPFFDR